MSGEGRRGIAGAPKVNTAQDITLRSRAVQTRRTTRSRGHAAAQRLVKRMEANAFLEALYKCKL